MGLMLMLLPIDSMLELLQCINTLSLLLLFVDASISMDKLFNQYIFIPHGSHLFRIMGEFFIHVAYLCDAIKESHILLSQKPNKWVVAIFANYYCKRKSCNSIVLQAICDMDKLFWNVCCSVLGKMTNGS